MLANLENPVILRVDFRLNSGSDPEACERDGGLRARARISSEFQPGLRV